MSTASCARFVLVVGGGCPSAWRAFQILDQESPHYAAFLRDTDSALDFIRGVKVNLVLLNPKLCTAAGDRRLEGFLSEAARRDIRVEWISAGPRGRIRFGQNAPGATIPLKRDELLREVARVLEWSAP